jgi:hypothetical protein
MNASSPSTFPEKLARMMRETGRSYQECCRELGRRGGAASASVRRSRAWESRKQEAQKIR